VVVLGLGCLVITLSRSGMVSFAVGFVLLFLYSMLHQKLRLRYVLARVLVIISMIAALGFASGDILRRFTSSDPGAVKFRWDMVYASMDMIMDHPVLGLGLNTFVFRFPEYSNPPGREAVTATYGEIWPVVHNSYLVTWTEQGTIGLAFLIGLYACTLWTGTRTARYLLDDRLYAINIGACCGVVAIMVDGLSSFFIDESASERVFFMVVGLIFALNYWTMANRGLHAGAAQARAGGTARVGALDARAATLSDPAHDETPGTARTLGTSLRQPPRAPRLPGVATDP
jgi:O-antigen ligase